MKKFLPLLAIALFANSAIADSSTLDIERNFTPNWDTVSKLFDKQYQSLNNVYVELCVGLNHKSSCEQIVKAVDTTISAAGNGDKPQHIEEKISKLNNLSVLAAQVSSDKFTQVERRSY
jgi:hypothetical protein